LKRLTLHLNGIALVGLLLGGRARAEELLVFAASSTQLPVSQLAQEFQAKTGGSVHVSFAASNTLARQISAGAPADVFLSADRESMDLVEKAGRVVQNTRVDLLSNRLVVVGPKQGALSVVNPTDLLSVQRLCLADPRGVPVGRYAKAWLMGEGLWEKLEPKVIPALDSRAALRVVELGGADAAIVYLSDAVDSKATRLVYRVPLAKTPSIRYPAARLTHAQGSGADEFLRFLRESHARTVFIRHGFLAIAP
jgi:molybdate transport system substrate-binding protein